jgi:hypothetical protein
MKKRSKKNLKQLKSRPSDYGNANLTHRHAVRLEQIHPRGGRLRLRILDSNELDKLLHEEMISIEQHFSGEKFGGEVQSVGGGSSCLANLTRLQTGGDQASNRFITALGKVVDAMRAMEKNTERGTSDLVMGVALNTVKINDDLLPHLHRGLDALGQHYSVARWLSPSFSLRR